MFTMKPISDIRVKESEKVLCLFKSEISKLETICFAFIKQNEKTGNVLNYSILPRDFNSDVFHPELGLQPFLCSKVPDKTEFTELKEDLSNVDLEKRMLLLFKDGLIESGIFYKDDEGKVCYAFFDGHSTEKNPIGYIELSDEINQLLDPEYD